MIGNLKGNKTMCVRGLKEETLSSVKSLATKYNLTQGEVLNQVVEEYARKEGVWPEQKQKVLLRKKQK
jgi:hypothetical protein